MIDKLDFILALGPREHFGRAARPAGSPSRHSRPGVKQLEEPDGRAAGQPRLALQSFTPEGQRVLDWARRIVGDTRAMREEINSLRHGLSGQLRIAAIRPPRDDRGADHALPRAASQREFTIYSRTSIEILELLDNLEIDAGITYLGNEPLGVSTRAALSRALPAADLGGRAARQPRPGDLGRGGAGAALPADARHAEPPHHRRSAEKRGRRVAADAGIGFDDPAVLARADRTLGQRDAGQARETLGLTDTLRAIPIVEPEAVQTIGLVVPAREPMMPITAALVDEAKRVAPQLDEQKRRANLPAASEPRLLA
jgi:DNA-binding transcriptional LysR family regulator